MLPPIQQSIKVRDEPIEHCDLENIRQSANQGDGHLGKALLWIRPQILQGSDIKPQQPRKKAAQWLKYD